ncbi:hypothetical protein RUM43_011833, partial [Polyplax serrata]
GENSRMDSTRKLWLLILLGACILMLQYHVSTTWNTPGLSGPSYPSSTSSEEVVASVVSKLQLDSSMVNTVGEEFNWVCPVRITRICFVYSVIQLSL